MRDSYFMVVKEKSLQIFLIKDSIGALQVPMVSVALIRIL